MEEEALPEVLGGAQVRAARAECAGSSSRTAAEWWKTAHKCDGEAFYWD
jgi:hypothetical protein